VELSTAALAAMLAAVVAVCIAAFTGTIGQPPPKLRYAARPGTPRTPDPVQRRAEPPRGVAAASGAVPSPAAVVTAYYAALDARRFRAAWRVLGGDVRSSFGGFAAWRAGFATTRSSRPSGLQVARSGRGAVVTLVLVAADRSPAGVVRRSFDVRWRLGAGRQGWVAREVTAAARATRG
jgi:hypothetical protein